MIMHSTLRRRHTWPFELVEVVCEEVHTDPHHPHLAGVVHVGCGGSVATAVVECHKETEPGNNNETRYDIVQDHHEIEHCAHHHPQLIQYEGVKLATSLNPSRRDHLTNLNSNEDPERTRLLSEIVETEENVENEKMLCSLVLDGNKTHSGCTCSGTATEKSSNNSNNHVHPTRVNYPLEHCVTIRNCKSVSSPCGVAFVSDQNNEKNQNPETFSPVMIPKLEQSPSPLTQGYRMALSQPNKDLLIGSNSRSSSGDGGKVEAKSAKKSTVSSGFQPIQDKFNFLTKKNRDSRKKKIKERTASGSVGSSSGGTEKAVELSSSASGTSGGGGRGTTPSLTNSISTSSTIKHKDFCPHSKYQQEKRNSSSHHSSRKSETNSHSSKSSGSVFLHKNKKSEKAVPALAKAPPPTEKADRSGSAGDCFTSTSSNNNSPSHSQVSGSHTSAAGVSLGSIGTSTQAMLNKNGGSSIGSGGSASGSGLKGSVTVVTANIINCNSHHETEGKIPSHNGTATGALSLQVNTANGEIKRTTLFTNYYPEGEWGWIVAFCALLVQAISHGLQLGVSTLLVKTDQRFHVGEPALLGLLSSTSIGVSLFLSPVWVSFCKIKSTRLSGVFGGLLASLGCLFTSFASQFHQLFFSYGAFIGVGVGLTRDASTLMVGQYFKRKREMVEIIVVSGSGVGIALMSCSVHVAITSIGWILGLQVITGATLLTFFLGTCYRSASLYHPQRRAILHLKNQKKKSLQVKDISKREEKPPFLDFSSLRSKTLQILLLSSAFISFGINSPLLYLGLESRESKVDEISYLLLHVYLGAAWVLGCCLFGFIAIQKNAECRVSKQYLTQVASVICGISIIAFTAVRGYSGYVVFSWVYGFSLGGYNYALKVYTYERVRARHFPRAWSFVQCSQAIPVFVGTPLISFLNEYFGRKSGYYASAAAVFLGSAFLFLTDVRRRRLSRRKANTSSLKTCSTSDTTQTPKMRRLSFAFPVDPISPHHPSKPDSGDGQGSILDPVLMSKELTCISEEGLAEIDFQDICFDDWAEYLGGDCITSCNKVENCLASEYDPDFSLLLDKRNHRRWSRNSIPFPGSSGVGLGTSCAMTNISSHTHMLGGTVNDDSVVENSNKTGETSSAATTFRQQSTLREIPLFRNYPWGSRPPPPRSITVIDEASV